MWGEKPPPRSDLISVSSVGEIFVPDRLVSVSTCCPGTWRVLLCKYLEIIQIKVQVVLLGSRMDQLRLLWKLLFSIL